MSEQDSGSEVEAPSKEEPKAKAEAPRGGLRFSREHKVAAAILAVAFAASILISWQSGQVAEQNGSAELQ